MNNIPEFAPGCFGSALAYDDAAPICTVCKFSAECQPLHATNLKALRESLGIPDSGVRKRKVENAPAGEAGMTMPVKTKALINRIEGAKLRVTESFANGVNPFANMGSNFLKIVGHLLLKSPRPLTRQDFAMAFQMKLNWSQGTADSHARMAIQALQYIGAIDEVDGAVKLRRDA